MKSVKIKLAERVSNILNPGILAILILIVSVYYSEIDSNTKLTIYYIVIVLNGLIPGLVYYFFTSRGYVFDDTLHHKQVHRERVVLYGVFLVITCLETLILCLMGYFGQPIFIVLVGGSLAIILGGLVSYFWKISMHSSIVTFFVMMILMIYGYFAWPVVLLIPTVWWSRLVLCRHTVKQLVGGSLASMFIVGITFYFFGLF